MSDGRLIHACPKPSFKKKEKIKVSKETKINVYERDHGCCVVCGKPVFTKTPHHIGYRSEGGEIDDPDNQVTLGNFTPDKCDCHFEIHHGSLQKVIDRFIKNHGLKKAVQCLLKGVIS